MLVEIVVAEVAANRGMGEGADIEGSVGQLAAKLAVGHVAGAIAQNPVDAIAEELVRTKAAAQVGVTGDDAAAFIFAPRPREMALR